MRRQLTAAVAAGLVLVAGGGVAYAQTQGDTGSYRTATVTVGDVDETLGLSGTVTASARQDLSFGASGTITKIAVAAGDTVEAGDVLARLDATDLETAVTKARATLAKARAQLETDQASQAAAVTESETPSTSGSDETPSSSTPSTTAPSGGSSSSKESGGSSDDSSGGSTSKDAAKATAALKAALKKLASQQTAVTTAQTAATDAIATAKSALATQGDACTVEEAEAPAETEDGAEGEDGESAEAPAPAGLAEACTTALDDVQAAQDVVASKQDTLQAALKDLSSTLTDAVTTLEKSASGSAEPAESTEPAESQEPAESEEPAATEEPAQDSGSSGSSGTAAPSTSSGSGSSAGSGGGTVTAATLAQDQAEIDTAKAELTEAQRALKAAKLTAPFAGEVLSVSAAKGDAVGDSDVVVVLVGDGSTTVTTTVTLEQVADVAVEQRASVTPAGAAEAVTGTVTAIGLLPDSSTDTATYPVTIELDGETTAPEGSTASIELVIGTAADVLTVPSSAVSTTRRTTVTVLTDGEPVPTAVTVGVVGATRTSITNGLEKGQQVVLADLDAELPSGDSTTTSLTGGGFPGGGGGMPGGGMRGGRG